MKHIISRLWLPLILALTACQQTPAPPGMKLGKPYVIEGRTYYPEYDPTYDKIGEASWYGPGFHGKYTANGEVYNQNDYTAAHPTLPMPSLVRVTNLSNGKSLIVRINDRGPFRNNRIIDLSKKTANELGIRSIAQVRVQFLHKETEEYVTSLRNGGEPMNMEAYNDNAETIRNASILQSTEPPSQIVEENVSSSRAGQTVTDAAPIVSVKSDEELNQTQPIVAKPVEIVAKPVEIKESPYRSSGLMRQAWADDNVTLPTPPAEEASAEAVDAPPPAEGEITPLAENPPPADNELAPAAQQMPATVVSGSYYIQVGSFAAEENARKLSGTLSDIGEVSVNQVEAAGRTWWRVRLGPFGDKQMADEALGRVRSSGAPDARIVHL